jgi:hypothetical protein
MLSTEIRMQKLQKPLQLIIILLLSLGFIRGRMYKGLPINLVHLLLRQERVSKPYSLERRFFHEKIMGVDNFAETKGLAKIITYRPTKFVAK